jgi:hypothetical protein
VRRSSIWAFGLLAAVASACGAPRVVTEPQAATPAAGEPAHTVALMRAHPHGPEADEITRWPGATLTPLWPTGGRHPVWRGCQHVYDPALSSYLFGGAEPAR